MIVVHTVISEKLASPKKLQSTEYYSAVLVLLGEKFVLYHLNLNMIDKAAASKKMSSYEFRKHAFLIF